MPLKLGNLGAVLVLLMFSFSNRLHGTPEVPCYFVFGDSSTDNGNNNNIETIAKANYPPYGIDFPGGPTGRFSNGRNIVDFIVEFLGFNSYILPFLNATGEDILRGVNYAAAGAGILDETGKKWGNISRFSNQVKNHAETVSKIIKMFGADGEASAVSHLSKCVYHVQIGGNDYTGNYFNPKKYSSSRRYNPELFANLLIQTYTEKIRTLYQHGARKMILAGAGPIGCMPSVRASNPQTRLPCIERYHVAVRIFNNKLKSLVDYLNRDYSDAKFIYLDVFNSFQELVDNPSLNGFRVTKEGCCGVGRYNGQFTCLRNQVPCRNREQYVFWDPFHLTEAATLAIVKKLFDYDSGSSSFTYPMTITQLAQL